jgi:transcriptional regulator with PAS, ATPase and Fis domain
LTKVYFIYTSSPVNNVPSFLHAVISDMSDATAVLSEQGDVLYCNQPFEELFGFARHPELCPGLFPGLDLKKRGGRIASPQALSIAGRPQPLTVFVYLINNAGRIPSGGLEQNAYLMMAKTADQKTDVRERRTHNPFSNEETFRTEKLEAAFDELIGANISFRKALVTAQRAAKSDISVLIIGESGTGKEILARAIHQTSGRKDKPLVDVNCAAIPDSLIESELFGYEKGAFTGARTEGRKGYFDEAHEGTILLDEIGDSSLSVQSKLLRVLESGTFKRVGGTKNIKVDVRIISSTNQDLAGLIEQKKFREDLFFRLNTFTIHLTPLRERREDIGLLVDYFLKINRDAQKQKYRFSPAALKILYSYHWPGNVRELKGVVSYAVNMTQSSVIDPSSLPNFLFSGTTPANSEYLASSETPASYNLTEAICDLERKLMGEVLSTTSNKSAAIKILGISRRTFYLKLKEYGLD